MKIFQKNYCQIGIGDVLYIVHDNGILEQLTVTKDHLTESLYMKPNERVVDNLYLASNYYEITHDGRLRLNTLKYIYPQHSDIPDLFKDTRLANVFVDKELALAFLEDRKQSKKFHKEFTEYPKILVYNTENDEVLDDISTSEPLDCLNKLIVLIEDFKLNDFNVDIAVFDTKTHKLIKDVEILNTLRKIIK